MAEKFGFKYGDTYDKQGTVQFYLPHQCDEWEIGDVDDMRAFIAEAQAVLREVTEGCAGPECQWCADIVEALDYPSIKPPPPGVPVNALAATQILTDLIAELRDVFGTDAEAYGEHIGTFPNRITRKRGPRLHRPRGSAAAGGER